MKFRKTISWLLIKLANKINPDNKYYDFGSPIISIQSMGKCLFVATKQSVFATRNSKTWKKIPVKN
jgi:hypothetical protein